MTFSRALVLLAASLLFSLACAAVAYTWADGYIDRLPNHRGYFLVPVENAVQQQPTQSPRRTVLVVVDGLGHSSAASMQVIKRLEQLGQCRPTYTGELTISRPVYTVLSTGLEADRTGSRNNDERSPVAVESIWQIAQRAGLRVHAASDVTWWKELFPEAFASYLHEPDTTINLFSRVSLGDLTLIHPSRVDTAGHKFGAASSEYVRAVELVDEETLAFIEELDLRKDLFIFTADHGHSDSGGHGGPGKRLSQVLTCFAGPGIDTNKVEGRIDARVIAPTMAVLLGLPFPKHMRAGEDSLDQIWTIVDQEALGSEYSNERRKGIETFRRTNSDVLGTWLGQKTGTWSQLYDRERRSQKLWWLAFFVLAFASMARGFRLRGLSVLRASAALLWMTCVVTAVCVLYAWVRGSLDFTSINNRQEFLNASLGVCFAISILGATVHGFIWRSLRALLLDQLMLVALIAAIGFAHRCIYGVPLGFPLPSAPLIFLPFLHGALVIALGTMGGLFSIAAMIQRLRSKPSRKADRSHA